MGDKSSMDRVERAVGNVVWVRFGEEPEDQFLAAARRCEEAAEGCEPISAATLRRCAEHYRSKARGLGEG
jgi:hypothetical protein